MLFGTQNDTPKAAAEASVALLGRHLAMTAAAQFFAKFAHWNVKGDGFFPAHELFDKVYGMLQEHTDSIAERITALGGVAAGLPLQLVAAWGAAELSFSDVMISETMNVRDDTRAMVQMLSRVANSYRAAIVQSEADAVTQNLYLSLAEEADHMLYFLEAGLRA